MTRSESEWIAANAKSFQKAEENSGEICVSAIAPCKYYFENF